MVSAVFHSPLATPVEGTAIKTEAAHAHSTGATALKESQPVAKAQAKQGFDWNGLLMTVLPPFLGLALLVGIWAVVSIGTKSSIPLSLIHI